MSEQLIMRWKNDGRPSEQVALENGFSVSTFPLTENAIDKWLDIMQYGLSEKKEDPDFYRRVMTEHENYDENKCFFIMHGKEAAASVTVICDYPKKEGYVHMVCCHEKYKGRGLGNALSRLALKVFKDEGMETAYLTTDDWRIPAIKSYLAIGFVPDRSTDDFVTRWDNIMKTIEKQKLYFAQKKTLDTFLEHHAITKQQYDKSLNDLTEKMGMSGKI